MDKWREVIDRIGKENIDVLEYAKLRHDYMTALLDKYEKEIEESAQRQYKYDCEIARLQDIIEKLKGGNNVKL